MQNRSDGCFVDSLAQRRMGMLNEEQLALAALTNSYPAKADYKRRDYFPTSHRVITMYDVPDQAIACITGLDGPTLLKAGWQT